MTYALTWLHDVLVSAGLKVAETPDWRTRGRAEMGAVKGVICHHTGTARGGNMPSLNVLINGRSDLIGPLCHLGLGRDGTFYLVAAGRANHAGAGNWEGIATGNTNFIGIEAENSGGESWPAVQMDAFTRAVAAIFRQIGAGANMACGHKEYAPGRKVDPSFDMPVFRSAVAQLLVGKSPPPPIPAQDSYARLTLRKGMQGPAVGELQQALGLTDNGSFDGATEAKVRVWQRAHGLVPDGIFGPRSRDVLDAQPLLPGPAPAPEVAVKVDPESAAQQIDMSLMKIAFPANTVAEMQAWIAPLRTACQAYGITSARSVAGLFANITVESASLTRLAENLNYSVMGLLNTFGRDRIGSADADRLGRKPNEGALSVDRERQIANIVYGGDWGRENLGNTQDGDGWNFRGYGPIQVTGRSNCSQFAETIGKAVETIPTYIQTREGGAMAAAWFWSTRRIDRDTADPMELRKAVNAGGLNFDLFQMRFDQIKAEQARRVAGQGE